MTAPGLGAEMIPFLRTYVSLPAAVAFAAVYSKLNNILSPSNVFYAVITPFLAFFAAFAAFLYPARDYLHPHAAADYLLAHLPVSYGPLISIFRNWTYTAFYTAAELWGSVVMSVLFWGLANQVCLFVCLFVLMFWGFGELTVRSGNDESKEDACISYHRRRLFWVVAGTVLSLFLFWHTILEQGSKT